MNLKKILENKPKLKEDLAMYILKSGIFDNLLKTNRHSAQQIVLQQLEQKIYFMNENELIEYFDSLGTMDAQITPVYYKSGRVFGYTIYDGKGNSLSESFQEYPNRKEATIECLKKLIELSN